MLFWLCHSTVEGVRAKEGKRIGSYLDNSSNSGH